MHTWTYHWPEVSSVVGQDETTSNVYPHLHETDIAHELLRVATHQRNRVAVKDVGENWSYERLLQAIGALVAQWRDRHIGEGDRVFIALPNTVEFVVIFLPACGSVP